MICENLFWILFWLSKLTLIHAKTLLLLDALDMDLTLRMFVVSPLSSLFRYFLWFRSFGIKTQIKSFHWMVSKYSVWFLHKSQVTQNSCIRTSIKNHKPDGAWRLTRKRCCWSWNCFTINTICNSDKQPKSNQFSKTWSHFHFLLFLSF